MVCVEPRLAGPVLQDTKVTLPGWRCRLCAECRTGVNHVPALANEPQSAGPCCSNAHTPVAAFAGAQRVLSMAQTGPAAGPGVPAIPWWVTGTGRKHGGGGGQSRWRWRGLCSEAGAGTACPCPSVLMGDRERHKGQEGFASFPTSLPPRRTGCVRRGLARPALSVLWGTLAAHGRWQKLTAVP